MSAGELKNYVEAVKVLMDRSVADTGDQAGYGHQARLHNVGRSHPDGTFGACEHDSEEFLPWHRAHLHLFEKLLQSAHVNASEVTIPFWDWTKPPSGARFPIAFEDPTSPLFHSGRWSAGSGAPQPRWDPQQVKDLVAEPDWNIFSGHAKPARSTGDLERGPHNSLHGIIGPTMGNPGTASEDPVYWSFHAYIDLIWTRRQKRHPQTYENSAAKLWLEPDDYEVADTTDTAPFSYDYDYDFFIDEPTTPVVLAAETNLNAADIGVRSLQTAPMGTIEKTAPLRIFLRLDGVQTFTDVTYEIRVFLHPTDLDLNALSYLEQAEYLIATRTMWRKHSGNGGMDMKTRLFIDITTDLAALNASDWKATVRADALPLTDPTAAELETARSVENARLETLSTVIESITVETR